MAGAPLLVTGLPRSGTSWVGKMLQASGEVVYVNEPMNPSHPPGRSPGVLDAEVDHYFQHVPDGDVVRWRRAFARTTALRYGLVRELRRNRRPYDVARAAKYLAEFTRGRMTGRRALLDDPYALTSVGWLADHVGVRAAVLVRDPVQLAGSWRRLGWHVDTGELLAQPRLVRDHLGDHADLLAAHAGAADAVDQVRALAALWTATTSLALDVAATRDTVTLVRYESLAADPLVAFGALYERLGLTWDEQARGTVDAATSPGEAAAGAGPATGRGFAWNLRGGPSRTAFRPMDSRAVVSRASGLDPADVAAVREITAAVEARLVDVLGPVPGESAG